MTWKALLVTLSLTYFGSWTEAQVCQPNDPYDQLISDFHSSAARRPDGSWIVWGERKHADGISNLTTPTVLSKENYPALSGNVLLVTLGSNDIDVTQLIVLTTTGLFASGTPGAVLSPRLKSNTVFAPIPVNGSANGLPPGLSPTDVYRLQATHKSLSLLTKNGDVWMLSQFSFMVTAYGPDFSDTKWIRIRLTDNTPLRNIVQLRISTGACFAIDENNQWFTWGNGTWNGSSLSSRDVTRATLINKPTQWTEIERPKMIGITYTNTTERITNRFVHHVTYFVLSSTGYLWAMGSDYHGTLANGPSFTLPSPTWQSVRWSNGQVVSTADFISVQEHDALFQAAAILTKDKQVFVWGNNSNNMLGAPTNMQYLTTPQIPGGFQSTDKAAYIEVGGHTIVFVRENADNYCYVGHRINGSMGDGSLIDANEATLNCSNTAKVELCTACPRIRNNSIQDHQSHCAGETPQALTGSIVELSTTTVQPSVQWVQSASVAFTSINGANQWNAYQPPPLYKTTRFRRVIGIQQRPDCPVDSGNTVTLTIRPVPTTPVIVNASDTFCQQLPHSLQASSTSGSSFEWWMNGQLYATQSTYAIPIGSAPQSLNVVARRQGCVSDTLRYTWTPRPLPVNPLTGNIYSACQARPILLSIDSLPNYSYQWSYTTQGIVSTAQSWTTASLMFPSADSTLHNGLYQLLVKDAYGCSATYFMMLDVNDCNSKEVQLPDAISPNNDGLNDVFLVKGLEAFPENELIIVNRWGTILFQEKPYKNNWGGQVNNGIVLAEGLAPEGTYFYILKLKEDQVVRGSVYVKP
ncbi:MAG: gliding motility-associated C-terminal domain-containing protein [Cytophagaceae bacterium]|jgi:gliding motility-associated-like protein|nr:gliding motility-associated C-terminal domain-containing protein [Cytophagaceae bacterium]